MERRRQDGRGQMDGKRSGSPICLRYDGTLRLWHFVSALVSPAISHTNKHTLTHARTHAQTDTHAIDTGVPD